MAETDGGGRLDRAEAILARLAITQEQDQERHKRDFKQLLNWRVLMQDQIEAARTEEQEYRREQRDRETRLDQRVDKLVSAIGELIRQ